MNHLRASFPIQVEGTLLDYAADAEVCPGTVLATEEWMRGVLAALLIDETQLLPVRYYLLEREEVAARCGGAMGCAEREGEGIAVYSDALMKKHELVHAIHLSVWNRRPALLEEGLATLFDDDSPQILPYSGDAEMLAGAIEIADPRDDSSIYSRGAYLSYWILDRHGPAVLTDLWSNVERGFAAVSGESLAELLAGAGTEPACPIVTCVGTPVPWVDGEWSMTAPTGCDDERVVGLSTGDRALYLRRELVEVTQSGIYELSSSAGVAFIVACGGGCSPLAAGHFVDAGSLPYQPVELVLEPGVYRVETQSTTDVGGYEVQIRLVN